MAISKPAWRVLFSRQGQKGEHLMSERRTRRPARGGTELITILWRDIPAQVTGRSGAEKVAIALPHRFQVAIDRAAAIAEKVKYDEYIGEWRREAVPFEGDVNEQAHATAERIKDEFTRERLAELVANGGYAPGRDGSSVAEGEMST
jgi:hypothetical protein